MARSRKAEREHKRKQRERRYSAGLTSRGTPRMKAPKHDTLPWALWRLGQLKRSGLWATLRGTPGHRS